MNGKSPDEVRAAAGGRRKKRRVPGPAMPPEGLALKQYEAALLLSLGVAKTDVAATLGVTRKTIYNWLELPRFRVVVDRLTIDHAEDVKNRLGAKALAVVEQALDARHIKARLFSERLSAARIAVQIAGINGQDPRTEVAAAAVLVYREPAGPAIAGVERVDISAHEMGAADRELRRVEKTVLGPDPDQGGGGQEMATEASTEEKPSDG